ncbi:M949_RS01915 family surface polysaccharide biosynthesis protein [Hymenobacter sp. GOD-10R]|uniref:M949_RS01915 family surface polysaccharide biosynthesis protein n=1 Tax=Hymenobacter sp. GOD-10R TaxID=3093922 RepID=UPI002D76D3C0|nr:hypothetical protein [Hymenobacter sp. GOD-10R]WRQ31134.1 hypothetical protein SD425_12780 [Hymenobacter sp. GOD-10R]
MNNYLLTSSFLFAALSAHAQLRVSPLTPAAVPATLKHAGRVVQAVRYTDRTGTYIVLATQTGPKSAASTEMDDAQRADLYAYQYPATGSTPTWQMHDFVTDCPVDLEARFRPKGLTVTDLDQNGTAEVWLVYRTVCRGDVSPSTQKIIMYEGPRKYAVRGTSRIVIKSQAYGEGGSYTFDAALKASPAVFRQHAAQLWKQHLVEDISE